MASSQLRRAETREYGQDPPVGILFSLAGMLSFIPAAASKHGAGVRLDGRSGDLLFDLHPFVSGCSPNEPNGPPPRLRPR